MRASITAGEELAESSLAERKREKERSERFARRRLEGGEDARAVLPFAARLVRSLSIGCVAFVLQLLN